MDYFSALIYGIVQGLTEFLPVSSSGHLVLLPQLLGIEDPGLVFDLSMHVGTALSIALYFRKNVKDHLKALASYVTGGGVKNYQTLNMVLATLFTFIFALVLKESAETYARQVSWVCFNLIFFGVIMYVCDRYKILSLKIDLSQKLHWLWTLFYGLSQALAIFPGVSRSGITLTYSRFTGMDREEATTFSFLLALPLIIAGFILKFPGFFAAENSFDLKVCFFGIAVSFVCGLLTIHLFLKFVKRVGLGFFALYRFALGLLIYWTLF